MSDEHDADAAEAWLRHVEEEDREHPLLPAPIDDLADRIRDDGSLDETPALALLDEIARLRNFYAKARAARDTLNEVIKSFRALRSAAWASGESIPNEVDSRLESIEDEVRTTLDHIGDDW